MTGLTFHAVDADHWNDLAALFERRGGPKNCWCMVWRAQGEEIRHTKGAERKRDLHKRVSGDIPVGILAFQDDKPVGWCSIGPRDSLRDMGGGDFGDDRVWSLTCFFIAREARGQGLSRQLLDHALAYARKHHAKWCEAYPVDANSPSYRFMGFVDLFKSAGFEAAGRVGKRRHVVRKAL